MKFGGPSATRTASNGIEPSKVATGVTMGLSSTLDFTGLCIVTGHQNAEVPNHGARYKSYEGEFGEWGVEQGGVAIYESICGFDQATAELMAEIMNDGKGLDGWCESDDASADLLKDRLCERGWVDPAERQRAKLPGVTEGPSL